MEVHYLVFVLSVLWHGTDAIMWSLAPNTQKCLKEELHANVLVAGEYDVTEVAGQRVDYIVSYKDVFLAKVHPPYGADITVNPPICHVVTLKRSLKYKFVCCLILNLIYK